MSAAHRQLVERIEPVLSQLDLTSAGIVGAAQLAQHAHLLHEGT